MLTRLAKDIAIYGSADFVIKLAAFAVFPVYAHVFPVSDFGLMALISATVSLIAVVANVGLNNAVQRFYWDAATTRGEQPAIVSGGLALLGGSSVGLVTLLLVALYPARGVLEARYGVPWDIVLLACLTVIPEQVLQFAADTLRLHFAPWKFVLVSLLKNIFGIAIGLVLILGFDAGLPGFFWGGLIGATLAVPLGLILIRKDLTLALDRAVGKRLVSFGYPFVFAGLAYWMFGSLDRWMLAELSDPVQLGLYGIAFKFATIVVFVNTAFGQAWSPMAIKLAADDSNYRATYSRVLSTWFFLLTLLGGALALFSAEVVRLVTPSDYWAAAPALAILAAGVVLSGTTQITVVGISLERKTKLIARASWITAALNFALNLALIPVLGAVGAALATFLSYGVLTLLYLHWSQRLHPIPLEKTKLVYCAGFLLAITLASPYLNEYGGGVIIIAFKLVLLALLLLGGLMLRIVDPSMVGNLLRARIS